MRARAHQRGCSVLGCDEPHFGLGYCRKHYLRFRRHGSTDLPARPRRVCRICGRRAVAVTSTIVEGPLCMTHYQRERRRAIRESLLVPEGDRYGH